jgi:hypothetical protein
MTYMRSWKSHRLTSHTWLGLNPQIGRPLSRIVGAIGLFFLYFDYFSLPQFAWIFPCIRINFNSKLTSSIAVAMPSDIEKKIL